MKLSSYEVYQSQPWCSPCLGGYPHPRLPKETAQGSVGFVDPRSPRLAPAKDSPHESVHVPSLLRDLPGNLVGAHGIVIWLLTEAEVVTQVDERQGDPEPHAEQGHHSGKGHLWAQHCEAPRALKPRPGAMQWGQGPSGS